MQLKCIYYYFATVNTQKISFLTSKINSLRNHKKGTRKQNESG